ncbi:MAG: alpha/beta hydrolase [Fimbriimonadaceae bacterium]|nr:alpha/beta hydrolase [Alphaproteobacteria bacterium]
MQIVPQTEFEIDRYPVRVIKADGHDFSYREAGEPGEDKPTLLLLHGIGSGSGSWVRLFDSLKAIAHLIAWDAPGYGTSMPLDSLQPVAADYAGALKSFCDGLGLKRFILIGHSLGAIMAARFACEHADLIVSLILAAPAQGYARRDAAQRATMIEERIGAMERLGPDGMANDRASKLLSRKATPDQVDLVAQNMKLLTRKGYAQAVHLLAQSHIIDDLSCYPHAVLLLCGSDDNITPPASVREIAAAAPQGDYVEIPDAGHACYIDQPDIFSSLVESEITRRSGDAL